MTDVGDVTPEFREDPMVELTALVADHGSSPDRSSVAEYGAT
jgi:hypothetical protein